MHFAAAKCTSSPRFDLRVKIWTTSLSIVGGLRIINEKKEGILMAAKKTIKLGAHHPKERIAYGIFVSALGALWLAAEMKWVETTLPIGPFIIIIIGFTMFLPYLKK